MSERANSAKPFNSNGRVGTIFGSCHENRAESNVVDGFGFGRAHLVRVMSGEADRGRLADYRSGIGGEKIVLSEVKACVEETGIVGAIVDDEGRRRAQAESGDLRNLREDFAAPEAFVAELKYPRASFQDGGSRVDGLEVQAFQRGRVDDRINPREWPVQFNPPSRSVYNCGADPLIRA